MKKWYNKYLNEDYKFDKLSWIGIFCLLIVITGINVYATGSIMIYLLTYRFRKKPLKVFLISFFSTGILEYISGLGMYIIGHGKRCWDYNNEILNLGNINGFVCLRSVTFFAISGLLLIYVVIPLCFYLAQKMNKKIFLAISIILCSIIMIDEFYNLLFARIFHLPRAYDVYKNIGFNYVKFK